MWSRFGYGYGSPTGRRSFSLGFIVLPFVMFLAFNAMWTPKTGGAWALQIALALLSGWILGWFLQWLFHRLFDAPVPK